MRLHELIPKEYCVRQRAYLHVHPHAYLGRAPLWVPAQTGQTRCRGASLSHQECFQEGEVTHPNKCRAGANQKGRRADISETCFALSRLVAFGLGMLTHPMTRVYRRGARDPTSAGACIDSSQCNIASTRARIGTSRPPVFCTPLSERLPNLYPTRRAAPECVPHSASGSRIRTRSASGSIYTPLGERLPNLDPARRTAPGFDPARRAAHFGPKCAF